MFQGALSFNGDISSWNRAACTDYIILDVYINRFRYQNLSDICQTSGHYQFTYSEILSGGHVRDHIIIVSSNSEMHRDPHIHGSPVS
jgi:hypothetical protein